METNRNNFFLFDIKDFYPTITKDLLTKCLKFAEEKFRISDDGKNNNLSCKKVFFFFLNEGSTWMKKDCLFDATMRLYDGADVCELVWTFLIDKINEKWNKNSIGLYRDDRLSVFTNKSNTQLERIKTSLQKYRRTLV